MPSFLSTSYANSIIAPMDSAHAVWQPFKSHDREEAWHRQVAALIQPHPQLQPKEIVVSDKRRLVRVLVVDPHEDVPVESGLLYDSKEVFTDKTDQELYFDVPVAQLLKEHNEKRMKVINKAVKDRTEYLEPARIRDLKMLVISLATF